MALTNARRQALHKLRESGRRGDPSPHREAVEALSETRGITMEQAEDIHAWAKGVWERYAENHPDPERVMDAKIPRVVKKR